LEIKKLGLKVTN